MQDALPAHASADLRRARWAEVLADLAAILDGEDDWVAAMATVACELHAAFEHLDWTGFYRAVPGRMLIVGPYQGGHGCLRIPFGQGVCGTAAETGQTQDVPDVHAFPGHIACSTSTCSELVVPVRTPDGRILAVLDLDSDHPAAFRAEDVAATEELAARLGAQFAAEAPADATPRSV